MQPETCVPYVHTSYGYGVGDNIAQGAYFLLW